ncbi:MAG: alginate export family protein [Verrucomicrobiaceae bacterium]|nr:alginate export family protein [Verrucomicrobiaceae bacterium]
MKRLLPILFATSSLALAGTPVTTPPAAAAPPAPPYAPIKYGNLTIDVQEKMRFEIRDNNFDFNSALNGPQDASWLLQRFRLGLGYDVNPWLKFYVQGQDVREIGGSRPNDIGTFGAEGDDVFDILKAYVQMGNLKKGISATIGRQFLSYGDQRLVGPLEWLNQARTFDAVKFRYAAEKYSLDFFVSSPVTFTNNMWNQSPFLDNDESLNAMFSGIYLATQFVPFNLTTDFYVYNKRDDGNGDFFNASATTDFYTFGTLWKGDPKKLAGWDYSTEMAFQTGTVSGRDLAAFAGNWNVGYNWLTHPWKPRLGVQYNYGSGDSNAADGDIGTFQNLYPTNHLFYGYMDTTGWINMHNPQLNLSFSPTAKLKIMLDYHLYWNATNNDAWRRVNGVLAVRPIAPAAGSTFRGQELDFTAIYKLNPHVGLQFGYSYFKAGDYLAATGASDDAHFGYAQVQIDF